LATSGRGKRVTAFAFEGDLDVDAIKSNTFEIEWPPKGGMMQHFPEIDRAVQTTGLPSSPIQGTLSGAHKSPRAQT
jgi:predicted NUDIX family NTP pyrophosphohydrolase